VNEFASGYHSSTSSIPIIIIRFQQRPVRILATTLFADCLKESIRRRLSMRLPTAHDTRRTNIPIRKTNINVIPDHHFAARLITAAWNACEASHHSLDFDE
jgi:hypothetical protein